MSVVIDRTHDFLGVPLVTVRNVLHAWRYGNSREPHEIAQRSNVKLPSSTVMVLLHELRERGLIGAEEAETCSGIIDLELPNLSAARRPFRPISASLAEPIVQEWGWWTRVVSAPPIADNIKRNAMLTRVNLDGCNGRERVCAISCASHSDGYQPKAALIFDREVVECEDAIKMCVRFQGSTHLGLRPDYLHAQALNKWIASLVTADVECIIRREKEVGGCRAVDLSFHDAVQTWITSYATESLSKGIDLGISQQTCRDTSDASTTACVI